MDTENANRLPEAVSNGRPTFPNGASRRSILQPSGSAPLKRGSRLKATPSITRPKGSPWRAKNIRPKQRHPTVKPPLPPKPEDLSCRRAGRLISADKLIQYDGSDHPERRGSMLTNGGSNQNISSGPISTSTPVRPAVTRSKSSHSIGLSQRRNSQQRVGELIARRKQFFHQLSHQGHDRGPVFKEGLARQTSSPDAKLEKKASWTSYVDLDESSSSSTEGEEEDDDEGSERSVTPVQETLATVDGSLAQAESLLNNLAVGENVNEERLEEDLEQLARRQRRISLALELLRKKRQSLGQEEKEDSVVPNGVTKSYSVESSLSSAKSSKAFNLFREITPGSSANDLDQQAPLSPVVAKNLSDDFGYLSDNSESSFSQVKSRVKDFFFDSFGKGSKKKVNRERPVIGSPLTTRSVTAPDIAGVSDDTGIEVVSARVGEVKEALSLQRSQSPTGEVPFFLDQKVNERMIMPESKGQPEEAIDTKMFEGRRTISESSDTISNRSSIISGTSNSSSGSGSHTGSSLLDTNENEVELSPEEKQAKKVYNIAKEIMTSEQDFVNVLKLINVEFKEHVEKAMAETQGVIPEKEFQSLFSNLLELQILNGDLLKDFQVRVENWENEKKIADIIVRKGAFLKLYTSYVQDFPDVSAHYLECLNKYPLYAKVVAEFEAQEQCRNLKISHFMLKPVQRLPQYKLLLETYLKNLTPGSEDYANATEALGIVARAAEHANEKMRHNDKAQRLLHLQTRLGVTDLVLPNRELVKEGEIQKISRSGIDLRYLILCTDCLIYAKYSGTFVGDSTSLRACYNIPLSSLKVEVSKSEEYPLDFSIISPVRSCTFRARAPADKEDWIASLESSVQEHHERRATFANAATFDRIAPGMLGESAPIWVPDERVTMCQKCHSDFTLLVRRHHCRACGKVVCGYCSANKAPLKYRGYKPTRVCDDCFVELQDLMEVDERLKNSRKLFKRDASVKPNPVRNVPRRLRVNASDEGAQMSGYLHKRSNKSKYKKMWFVLKDRVLYEYRAPEDSVANDTFPVLGFDLDLENEIPSELSGLCDNGGRGFKLTHIGSNPLVFFAETEPSAEKWTAALISAVSFE